MKRYIRNMNMFDAVTASITDPYGTMEHLLKERETPPYIISSVVALFLVLILPTIIYQYTYDIVPADVTTTYALITTLSVTLIFFVLFQCVLLRMVGVSAPVIKILAVTIYSLTPMIPLMVGYYIANYMAIGHISVLTFFVTGRRAGGDWFLTFLPQFINVAIFSCLLVFSQGIRVIGRMGILTGFIMACVAIPMLLGAFLTGASCSETLFRGSAATVTHTIAGFYKVPGTEEK